MRGKVSDGNGKVQSLRITPAHAGKRCCSPRLRSLDWDHPRACGEKVIDAFVSVVYLGSPPRMRGKARKYRQLESTRGITPAHAGKSEGTMQAEELK